MRVLPDTPIWSAAFRRQEGATNDHRTELEKLLKQGVVEIIGPIRQELMSAIREPTTLPVIRDRLRAFLDLPI